MHTNVYIYEPNRRKYVYICTFVLLCMFIFACVCTYTLYMYIYIITHPMEPKRRIVAGLIKCSHSASTTGTSAKSCTSKNSSGRFPGVLPAANVCIDVRARTHTCTHAHTHTHHTHTYHTPTHVHTN